MPKKMLIDASHPEETRVVVCGHRIEDFDFESVSKKPLKGNIYLAKVTRVEPSLQAAFVEYGGNRHGFLAFTEMHPDYYQIPVADRQALIEAEKVQRSYSDDRDDEMPPGPPANRCRASRTVSSQPHRPTNSALQRIEPCPQIELSLLRKSVRRPPNRVPSSSRSRRSTLNFRMNPLRISALSVTSPTSRPTSNKIPPTPLLDGQHGRRRARYAFDSLREFPEAEDGNVSEIQAEPVHIDTVGGDDEEGDALEEMPSRPPARNYRPYKIQEVIRRRQVVLVQVVKEERGNKGAALTSYLSLAGRYCVLMPNTPRGGGISRKITNQNDRRRLKEIAAELDVPEGMGVIIRTAGASRTRQEIRRDYEYLLRLWESVREMTLKSTAPALIYEEGDIIKRAIRDSFTKDIDEVLVARAGSLRKRARLHAHAHARASEGGAALRRPRAAFSGVQGRELSRLHVQPEGATAFWRIHRHQRDGGLGCNRRELGPSHA